MKYKASIILPCYNKAHSIKNALNSLINCTRFSDFEVFIIDDCSTDDSYTIAKQYDKKYANITATRLPEGSGSPSKPRNVGMEMSSAPYIIFMDPDDIVINDGYSLLLTKMEEHDSDILIGTRIGVRPNGKKAFTDFIDPRFKPVNENNDFVRTFLLTKRPFILKTIYKRSLIKDNNISFCERITTSEDAVFDITCLARAKKVTKIDDIVYQYTSDSTGSITTAINPKIYHEYTDVLKELYGALSLSFTDVIIAEKLVDITIHFYFQRMSYMSNIEDIEDACDSIHDAMESLGFEKFDCLIRKDYIRFVDDIKQRRYFDYVTGSLLKRTVSLNNKLKSSEKSNAKLKSKLKKADKSLSKKSVKIALALSKFLSSTKHPSAPNETTLDVMADDHIKMFHAFYDSISDKSNGYWSFMDRPDNAKDNGEALYRYVKNNQLHDKLAFILRKDSIDYHRLCDEGFNVVEYNSVQHWNILRHSEFFFTSHCDGYLRFPWYYTAPLKVEKGLRRDYPLQPLYKMVFLQHGVIRSDLSDWLGKMTFHKFVASAYPERNSLLGIYHYNLSDEMISFTGLPRWDALESKNDNIITIFPTWRKDIFYGEPEELSKRFFNSEFFANWRKLLSAIVDRKNFDDFKIQLVMHHDNDILLPFIKDIVPEGIELIPYSQINSWSEIVNTSNLLITDYSSLSFDFLYLDKPVIYFDFEENASKNNIKGMEYDNFGYYCKTVEEVMKSLHDIDSNGCHPSNDQLSNIAQLFVNRSGNHCHDLLETL